jgi:hypothetical protein
MMVAAAYRPLHTTSAISTRKPFALAPAFKDATICVTVPAGQESVAKATMALGSFEPLVYEGQSIFVAVASSIDGIEPFEHVVVDAGDRILEVGYSCLDLRQAGFDPCQPVIDMLQASIELLQASIEPVEARRHGLVQRGETVEDMFVGHRSIMRHGAFPRVLRNRDREMFAKAEVVFLGRSCLR